MGEASFELQHRAIGSKWQWLQRRLFFSEGLVDDPLRGRVHTRIGDRLEPLVPGISEDTRDEGEEAACAPIEDEQSAVAILHRGRVDDDVQQQAERVDQDMSVAAGDFLGRIKALRVKRGAPF